jgi:hypothetical protein
LNHAAVRKAAAVCQHRAVAAIAGYIPAAAAATAAAARAPAERSSAGIGQTSAASQDCASAAVTATASVASIIEFAIAAIPADRPAVAILSNVSRRGCFQAVLK